MEEDVKEEDQNEEKKKKKTKLRSGKKVIIKKSIKLLFIIILLILLFILIAGAGILEIIRLGAVKNSNNTDDSDYRTYGPGAYSESITISTDDITNGVISFGMSVEEMWENDERYSEYLYTVDELEYLLNAQFVTQYPYIASAGEDELNGTIRFYRNDSEDEMVYVSYDTLESYINSYNGGDTSVLDTALNAFTLNSDGSIMVAYLTEASYSVETNDAGTADSALEQISGSSMREDNGNYIVSTSSSILQTKNISYLSYVQNYTLPFNLLWSIVVMGHSDQEEAIRLATSIADMAYEGEISLIIDDNNMFSEQVDEYEYYLTDHYNGTITSSVTGTYTRVETDEYGEIYVSSGDLSLSNSGSEITITDYQVSVECRAVYTETHNENSPTIVIRRIESWCAIFENDVTYEQTSSSNSDNPNTSTIDNSDEIHIADLSVDEALAVPIPDLVDWRDSYESQYQERTVTAKDDSYFTTYNYTTAYEGTIEQTQNYTDINISSVTSYTNTGYTNGTVTSPVFNEEVAEKFNANGVSNVRSTLCNAEDNGWLILALEVNEDTANLVDLMKYIINVANGDENDTDWESIWSSIYQDSSFNSVSTTTLMDFIQEYVRSWEGCTEISSDGTQYKIEDDGYGYPTVGYGVNVSVREDTFTSAGYSTEVGSWVDVEFVDALELEQLQAGYDAVVKETADLNLTGYQIAALVSRYYNCGSSGWKDIRNGKTFVQAYAAYWSDSKTEEYYGQTSNTTIYSESLYTEYMYLPNTSSGTYSRGLENRRKDEWLLFTTGYSERANLQWSDSIGESDIVSVATRIHNYIRENQYAYSCTHNVSAGYVNTCNAIGEQSTFGKSLTATTLSEWYDMRCIDCSAFVSWVLYESGIDVGRQSSEFFYRGYYTSYTQYTWQKITDWNDLQAGDILVRSGHVGIYIGDGYTLEAGSTNSIRAEKSYGNISSVQSSYSFAVRVSN